MIDLTNKQVIKALEDEVERLAHPDEIHDALQALEDFLGYVGVEMEYEE
jgi:hypothetical protein